MEYIIIRTGTNSVTLKTNKGINVKMNFILNDNFEVEDNVTNSLLMSYEERVKNTMMLCM